MIGFRPFVPRAEVLERVRAADACLVLLGDERGMSQFVPGKLFDYIGLDAPVLAVVPTGEVRSVLNQLDWGVVTDPTPAGVADGLNRLLNGEHRTGTADRRSDLRARRARASARVRPRPGHRPARLAMNVLWLTTDYPWPGDPVGGIFHRTAARCLVREGVGVTVVSPTPMAPWPLPRIRERWRRYAQAPRRQLDDGVEILRPRYPVIPGDPAWSRTDAVIAQVVRRTLARRPEIGLIHAHYPAPMGMAAWHLAHATGLPYVVTLHGSDDLWRSSHRSRLAEYRQALREASRILAVSQSMADEARQIAGVDATVLPIGIDVSRFANPVMTPEAARRELRLPPDRVVVLLVATLLPAKGVRPFVDAVVELGDPYLAVVVGEGPEYGYRASDAGARNRVDYRGAHPNEAIPLYLAAADMLILPSETEGLPTVLVEAGAAGVPVIASAVGGIPELLADDRGLLMPRVSTSAIVEAIATVRADPTTANARAERLRSFVGQEYDAAANARRLADVYRSVVDERLSGPG